MTNNGFYHALKIVEDKCFGCTHCMMVCPTEALRVVNGKARLINNRCVDCGKCMQACPVGAIIIEQDDFSAIFKYKARVALVPSVLIGQFPRDYHTRNIYSCLLEEGFTHVYESEHSVSILIDALNHYMKEHGENKPTISSFCPAVVRLIQVRFPSLVDHIARIKPPLDLAAISYKKELMEQGYAEDEIGIFYITPCAAKIAAVKSPVGEKSSPITGVINMNLIFNKIFSRILSQKDQCLLPQKEQLKAKEMSWTLTGGESKHIQGRSLAIDDMNNVIDFLEKIEDNSVGGFDFLELRACDGSCAGGILNTTNKFLTTERLYDRIKQYETDKENGNITNNKSIEKHASYVLENIHIDKIEPRSMLKLDEDFDTAMYKMEQMNKLIAILPGIDCGACGSPTCRTLAEDVIQHKSQTLSCVFLQHKLNIPTGKENKMEKIWGANRFNDLTDK